VLKILLRTQNTHYTLSNRLFTAYAVLCSVCIQNITQKHVVFVFTVAIQTTTMVICSFIFTTDFKLKYGVHVDCQLKLSQLATTSADS